MDCLEAALRLSQSLLTPVIAGIAVYIAHQQWKTNDLKVRIELFDRRLAVYDAAADLMYQVISQGDLTWEQLRVFSKKAKDSQFLFSDEVGHFLSEMGDKAEELIRANESYRHSRDTDLGVTSSIKAHLDKVENASGWFKDQSPKMKTLFRAKMSLN